MSSRNTGRIKKYGVCLNEKCENYKVPQEILHGDLECPICHKKLSPCAPPKNKKSKKPVFTVAAIAVLAVIIGCLLAFSGGGTKTEPEVVPADTLEAPKADTVTVVKTDTVVKADTVYQVDTVKVETVIEKEVIPVSKTKTTTTTQTTKATTSSGTLRLSYGTYTGATKRGYPHGQGRLTYSTTRQINRNDVKGRTANAGDYVIGEFYNGFVVYGKHYDAEGNLLGSLNFGVGAEDSYDAK